jgi:hypothetical protein
MYELSLFVGGGSIRCVCCEYVFIDQSEKEGIA